jgi:glycosyltransferase involved in cell wall biosynthesis
MKKPKISVIMAVYNAEKFLDKSIQSVLGQTLRDFELIIINDFSKDSSLRIIKKHQAKDKRIILINAQRNLGRAKARNRGLKIARGKYIAILDADDIALPERLERQYGFLEKNNDIFLVGSGALNIDENGNTLKVHKAISNPTKVAAKLAKENCLYHSSIMFRNDGAYFYREKFPYSQDYDLYLRILSDGKKIANIREPLIKYRINPSAASWSKKAKQKLFAEKAKEFYFQRLKHGKDKYGDFNPNEILNINVEKSNDKIVLESEIKVSFKLNNFTRTRRFCVKYFKHYGYLNKILLYYFLSFTGKRYVSLIRKVFLI